MPAARINLPLALTLSLGLHAGLVALWVATAIPYRTPAAQDLQIRLEVTPPPPENLVHSARQRPARKPKAEKQSPLPDFPPPTGKQPVTMAAPAAPTAEEWALASTYTLKNSKRYRYNWGQQVRSMMGTAVEGVRQGMARIHVEIAPNGKLARVDVLWSTSEYVEKRVLQAIHAMPPLPATPTGKPLTFEKTIAFVPFETGWPPIYKNDCLLDPATFQNPFAWNGTPQQHAPQANPSNAIASSRNAATQPECPDAGPDSIDAEEKDMARQFRQWGAARLNGAD